MAWNAFQRAHGGQGYSRSEMSSMYQASKSSGGGSSSYSSSPSYSSSSYSSPAPSYSTRSSYSSPASSSGGNAWNTFQAANRGKGYSRAEMSELYQASKQQASRPTSSPRATSYEATPAKPRNAWNDFQRQHAGQGYTSSELSEMYHRDKPSSASREPPTPEKPVASRKSSAWNDFQRAHKGEHLSSSRMAALYHRQRRQEASAAPAARREAEAEQYVQDHKDMLIQMYRRDTARNLMGSQGRGECGWQIEQVHADYGCPEQYAQARYVAFIELKEAKAAMKPKQNELVEGYAKQLDTTAEIAEADLKYGKELGRGAFGIVLRAEWKEAQVAVKVLAKLSKKAGKQFIEEVKRTSDFKHEGIVQVHGWTRKDASLGLVMELMTDGSLHDQIHVGFDADTVLTLPMKVTIAKQVTDALVYLHDTCDMAHRDIKPQNVLLSLGATQDKIQAKLCDFGFIKIRNSVRSSTASQAVGIFVGTPGYAAPEDFQEQVEDDDVSGWKACDVYSMGVLLWEMFEEDQPHCGKSITAIKKAVIAGTMLEFDETPEEYRSTLTKMWQLKPSDRPVAAAIPEAFEK
eukprot:m.50403 g.50403  ORF g.50403 m.50403 type:complete len:575 (+) comp13417_c0_seq1:213-1937(+)